MDYAASILQIIECSGELESILSQLHYHSSKESDLCVIFTRFSIHHIINIDSKLGCLILCNQKPLIKILKEIIFSAIQALNFELNLSIDRIVPDIIFYDIPIIKECVLECRASQYGRLSLCDGQVLGVSLLQPFVNCRLLFCPDEMCRGHSGERRYKHDISEAFDTHKSRSEICNYCGMRLAENIQYQSTSNYLSFTILVNGGTSDTVSSTDQNSTLSAHLTCVAKVQLKNEIRIGRKCRLIGKKNLINVGNSSLQMFEVNHVEGLEFYKAMLFHRNSCWRKFMKSIPDSIESVDFGIGLTMSFMFCNDVSPPGTYFLLRLMLLLFLVSENESSANSESDGSVSANSPTLSVNNSSIRASQEQVGTSILIISKENCLVHRLLECAGKFSENFQMHSVWKSIIGTSSEKRELSEQYFGGTLLLASGGTAYIPYLDYLPSREVNSLTRALEFNEASISSASRESLVYRQQLNCNVWANLNTDALIQTKGSHFNCSTSFQTIESQSTFSQFVEIPEYTDVTPPIVKRIQNKALQKLVNTLDLVYISEMGDNHESISEQIAQHFIQQSVSQDNEIQDYSQLYSEYLDTCRQSEVTITCDAEAFLKSYYMAGRKASSRSEWVMPQSAMKTLLFLAKGCTKLSCKSFMTIGHVILAIYLYEISLKNRIGSCNLKMQVFHHVQCMDSEFLERFSREMSSIYRQVMEFISIYESEIGNMEE